MVAGGGGELEGWVNRNVSPLAVCVGSKACPQFLSVSYGRGVFFFSFYSGMSFGEFYVTNCFEDLTNE